MYALRRGNLAAANRSGGASSKLLVWPVIIFTTTSQVCLWWLRFCACRPTGFPLLVVDIVVIEPKVRYRCRTRHGCIAIAPNSNFSGSRKLHCLLIFTCCVQYPRVYSIWEEVKWFPRKQGWTTTWRFTCGGRNFRYLVTRRLCGCCANVLWSIYGVVEWVRPVVIRALFRIRVAPPCHACGASFCCLSSLALNSN